MCLLIQIQISVAKINHERGNFHNGRLWCGAVFLSNAEVHKNHVITKCYRTKKNTRWIHTRWAKWNGRLMHLVIENYFKVINTLSELRNRNFFIRKYPQESENKHISGCMSFTFTLKMKEVRIKKSQRYWKSPNKKELNSTKSICFTR